MRFQICWVVEEWNFKNWAIGIWIEYLSKWLSHQYKATTKLKTCIFSCYWLHKLHSYSHIAMWNPQSFDKSERDNRIDCVDAMIKRQVSEKDHRNSFICQNKRGKRNDKLHIKYFYWAAQQNKYLEVIHIGLHRIFFCFFHKN